MARYVNDYQGISGQYENPRGLDPNYRGPYQGMRMRAGGRQGAYGVHRLRHPDDFEGAGGFLGRYGRRGLYSGEYEAGYGRYGGEDERAWENGGVRDLRRDPDALRMYNVPGAERQLQGRGYDRDLRRGDEPRFRHSRENWPEYSNRGLAGGYSEGWAWGPMRGAR